MGGGGLGGVGLGLGQLGDRLGSQGFGLFFAVPGNDGDGAEGGGQQEDDDFASLHGVD